MHCIVCRFECKVMRFLFHLQCGVQFLVYEGQSEIIRSKSSYVPTFLEQKCSIDLQYGHFVDWLFLFNYFRLNFEGKIFVLSISVLCYLLSFNLQMKVLQFGITGSTSIHRRWYGARVKECSAIRLRRIYMQSQQRRTRHLLEQSNIKC